jgi:hypothetical protein
VDIDIQNADGLSTTLPAAFIYLNFSLTVPMITSISPSLGPVGGGTLVTIVGTGFLSAPLVQVGAAPCEVNVSLSTTTKIVCTTGPSAAPGSALARVVNAEGQVAYSPSGISFVYQ